MSCDSCPCEKRAESLCRGQPVYCSPCLSRVAFYSSASKFRPLKHEQEEAGKRRKMEAEVQCPNDIIDVQFKHTFFDAYGPLEIQVQNFGLVTPWLVLPKGSTFHRHPRSTHGRGRESLRPSPRPGETGVCPGERCLFCLLVPLLRRQLGEKQNSQEMA